MLLVLRLTFVGACSLQVLCAHVYGVTLLQERETILGLAGSAAIAAGVVTVNSAKIAKTESGPLAGGTRGGALVQYTPVNTSPYAADLGESGPDATALPEGSSWRECLAHPASQLAEMHSGSGLDGATAREEVQPLHVSEPTGQLAGHTNAQQAHAGEQQLGSRVIGTAGSSVEVRPGGWTAGGPFVLSPRQHRYSVELQRVSQAGGIPHENSGLCSELPESQAAETRDQGAGRFTEVRTDRRSLDRGQNLRDREPSFGDWHFKRVPGYG